MSDSDDNNIPQYFKEVTSVILDYANEEKETDYAILLDGDWGCGKTWFIEKTLKKALEKDTKKTLLYISAAGIKDTTEFINAIYFKLLFKGVDEKKVDIAKSSGKGIAKALKTLIPNDAIKYLIESGSTILPNIIKDKVKFSNTLIVIDDLERISETIKIEDFLYRIYDTFVSQNVKVLFVANENAINKTQSKYNDIKEKVIRHTISLYDIENKSFGEIISSIARDKLEDTEYIKKYFIDEAFFMEHMDNIKDLFNQRNHFNLRTYITYLDLAKKILPIDERLKKHKNTLIKLLNTLCFVLIELNSNNQKPFHNYFCNDEYELKKSDPYNSLENNVPEKKKIYSEEEERYYDYVIGIQKINIPISLYYSNSIFEIPIYTFVKYREAGYLDTKQIIKNYEHILSNDTEYEDAYNTLKNAHFKDCKDLKKAINIIVLQIKENSESFNIQNLADTFDYLKKVAYILSDEQKDVFTNITDSIKDKILNFDKFDFDEKNIDMRTLNLDRLSKNHELYDIIQKTIDEANKNENKRKQEELLSGINNANAMRKTFYILHDQKQQKLIFEPQFLSEIIPNPFAITLFSEIMANQPLFKDFPQLLENLENYIDKLPYDSYDLHLQKQIDKLKEKIKSLKRAIDTDTH